MLGANILNWTTTLYVNVLLLGYLSPNMCLQLIRLLTSSLNLSPRLYFLLFSPNCAFNPGSVCGGILAKMTATVTSSITVTVTKNPCILATQMTTMQGLEISELVTKTEQDYEALKMIISTTTSKETWLVAMTLKGNKISTNMEDQLISAN